MKRMCVYCGSSAGKHPEYSESARALGIALAQRGIELVYGGASVGIMGTLADTVLQAGGKVIGVIPEAIANKEVAHKGLSELKVVGSMHERKSQMAELADGFIALPGGFGTLEELFEILTWSQLGFHKKPCALLNIQGYYNSLQLFLEHAVEQQFIKAVHHDMLLVESEPSKLLARMENYQAITEGKWIN